MTKTDPASRRWNALALVLLLQFPALAQAQDMPDRFTVLGAKYGSDWVEDNPDWTTRSLSAARHGVERSSLYAEWLHVGRFGVEGSQFGLGATAGVGERSTLMLDGTYSNDQRLFAHNSVGARWKTSLDDRWAVHVGGRQHHYLEVDSTEVVAGIELFPGDWRLGVELVHGRLQSGESGNSVVASYDRLYGAASQVGVSYVTGEEADRVAADAVALSDVRGATLSGTHWFGPTWGMVYEYGRTRQADFYTREGFNLGLRMRF